jgi:intein/homing endonuclease
VLMELTNQNLWDEVYEKATLLGGKTFTNRVKIPKELTPELAYLAGALRDGALSTYKNEFVISQSNKEWLEKEIKPILEKIFKIKVKVKGPRKKDNCYYIKFRSVALFAIIETLLEWNKFMWNTPSIILKAPLEYQKEYIRGFWDAEGSNDKDAGIVMYQAWPSLSECPPLSDISCMLRKINIDSWFRKPQKGTNKPVHVLYIPKRYKKIFFTSLKPFYKFNSTRPRKL